MVTGSASGLGIDGLERKDRCFGSWKAIQSLVCACSMCQSCASFEAQASTKTSRSGSSVQVKKS